MRLHDLRWDDAEQSLWNAGYARLPVLLTAAECRQLTGMYADASLFRSRIDMARYRFGVGDYQYFHYPLPPLVRDLRQATYAPLAKIANGWMEALADERRFPGSLTRFTAECKAAGQNKATPLLLHYETGGYNCLHQDLYGDIAFPLQLVVFLSQAGTDYTGGDFLLVEQRPRAQSIGHAIHAAQGEAVVFTTRWRPVKGSRGYYRANIKHGVSPLLSGTRYTLGIIYHDAR